MWNADLADFKMNDFRNHTFSHSNTIFSLLRLVVKNK